MSIIEIVMPQLSSNEDDAKITEWHVNPGQLVNEGDVIASVETTKTSVDIEARNKGYFHPIAMTDELLHAGKVIAYISADRDFDFNNFLKTAQSASQDVEASWTKKAELIANKNGVSIEAIFDKIGRKVTEKDVLVYQTESLDIKDLVDDKYPTSRRERVLLIAGGGGGGALAIEAINKGASQVAVGILDANTSLHGKTQFGVPILGSIEQLERLFSEGSFDSVINIFTANIEERAKISSFIRRTNIPLTNVIDPSVEIRSNVKIGTGNLIMANCYFAACTKIGDDNFFASHTVIEHHSIIGNGCTFGPRCTTSGAVTIGDGVKFGMNVAVEPYLSVGSNSIVPSGSVVTTSIPQDSVLRRNFGETIAPLNK